MKKEFSLGKILLNLLIIGILGFFIFICAAIHSVPVKSVYIYALAVAIIWIIGATFNLKIVKKLVLYVLVPIGVVVLIVLLILYEEVRKAVVLTIFIVPMLFMGGVGGALYSRHW